MKLVIDANILFSAFLKDGLTRRIWFDSNVQLYAPAFVLEEYAKYRRDLAKRAKMEQNAASALFSRLMTKVNLAGIEEFKDYLVASQALVTDQKDHPYVACALAVGADLWSRDRHLRQLRIRCWDTQRLAEHLGIR